MMTAVETSELAVRTLDDVDPDFRELLDTLYGPDVSAQEVYSDVFKFDPGPSDLHAQSEPSPTSHGWKRKAALAATGAGATMAVRDLGHEAGFSQGVKAVKTKLGFKVPVAGAHRAPGGAAGWAASRKGKVGLAATALGGDILVGDTLHGDAPPKQPKTARYEPVEKLSLRAMKNGIGVKTNALLPKAFRSQSGNTFIRTPKPPKANMTAKPSKPTPRHQSQAQANGAAAHQLASSFVRTKTGKVLIAGGTGKVGYDRYQGHQRRKNESEMSYQGYSPAAKADTTVEWAGTFSKLDEDKHLAFGWASVVKLNGLPIVDKQDDYITPEDLETAVYSYMINSRTGGHMHKRDANDVAIGVSDMVESMVFTDEKIAKMGLPDSMPRGWWVGAKIHNDEVWQEVKKGNLPGFSIHGRGRRTQISEDELMGWAAS